MFEPNDQGLWAKARDKVERVLIDIAPLSPAEFVVLRIAQKAAQVEV